jgi:hypothetical protein
VECDAYEEQESVVVLVVLISILAIVATSFGIFTNDERGIDKITSVHGQKWSYTEKVFIITCLGM